MIGVFSGVDDELPSSCPTEARQTYGRPPMITMGDRIRRIVDFFYDVEDKPAFLEALSFQFGADSPAD